MLRRVSPFKLIAFLTLSVGAIALVLTVAPLSTSKANIMPEGPGAQQMTEALIRAGLQPDALTAAGVSSNSVTTVVNNVKTYLTNTPGGLESADSAIGTSRPVVDSLERVIRSGQGSPQDLSALASARALLNAALTSRQTELDAIFEAGAYSLPSQQKSLLAKVRTNRSWDVTLEFTVVDRTEPQWVALREALANERIAAHDGEEPDAAAHALLLEARADGTVAAAAANLQTNLASVTAAWNAAVAP